MGVNIITVGSGVVGARVLSTVGMGVGEGVFLGPSVVL